MDRFLAARVSIDLEMQAVHHPGVAHVGQAFAIGHTGRVAMSDGGFLQIIEQRDGRQARMLVRLAEAHFKRLSIFHGERVAQKGPDAARSGARKGPIFAGIGPHGRSWTWR